MGLTQWTHLRRFEKNLKIDDKFIKKRVRLFIHQTMRLKRVEKYQDVITTTFL